MSEPAQNPAPSLPQPFIPKLSILHLLLFTLATGLSLTLLGTDGLEGMHPVAFVLFGSDAMLMGAALTGTVILAWRLAQRKSKPEIAPGHWLLVSFALVNVVTTIFNRFAPFGMDFGEGINAWSAVRHMGIFLASTACTAVWAAAAYVQRSQRRWQVYSICQGLVHLLAAVSAVCVSVGHFFPGSEWMLSYLLDAFKMLPALAGAIAFVVAVVLDLVGGVPRVWLHHVGIAIAFLDVFLVVASNLVFAFL